MSLYDQKAAELQSAVIHSESKKVYSIAYDEETTKQSIVHARQDIVLLVSHLSSINDQMASIRCLLLLILCALAFFVYRILL
jgi:hypothetical protein